jgi:hypothetical protein
MNSVKCWEQLRRMGIQSDLHTLVGRGHCFQRKAAPETGSYTWMGRIWEFMNHKGKFQQVNFARPRPLARWLPKAKMIHTRTMAPARRGWMDAAAERPIW